MNKEKFLKDNWKVLKFSECIEQLNTGLNPRNHFSLGKGNIKYITAKNLTKSGTLDFSKYDFIDERAKSIINKRSDIKIGDILFSSRAPIGHCHLIKDEPDYFDIGESIFSIRVNKEIVLPEYLCLYLSSDYFIKLASRNTTGSIIQEIRITDLMNTGIIIPPKNTQKYIAEVITKLDKKIELNNKINSELENMVKIIYNYWFLQFEFPNDEGKPYKSSGGKMVWNEELKKEIPEGWEINKLEKYIKLERGISYTSKNIKNKLGIPMINLASIDINKNYRPNELKFYEGEYNSQKEVFFGEMLIACTDLTRNADIIGSPILVPNDKEKYIYSMDLVKINLTDINMNPYYLYMLLRTDFYHKYIKGFASGTNVLHLDVNGVLWFKTYIPPKNIQDKFSKIIEKYHNKKCHIIKENQELTSLRDYLLPLLMNGQIGFKD